MLITVCALIYAHRKPVDNDHKHIARLAGCSPRMARSLIDSLIKTDDLTLDTCGKLCQKTCMEELFIKFSRLEKSAKGGRTSGETRREKSKNNALTRSTPLPSPISNKTSSSLTKEPRGNHEVLKKRKWKVIDHLTDKGIEAARKAAPDWDIYALGAQVDAKVDQGSFKPPETPDRAFPAWCAKYTKGKRP